MKTKFLVVGIFNILFSLLPAISSYFTAGTFRTNIWFVAIGIIGLIFLIFYKIDSNKFIDISVQINLGACMFLALIFFLSYLSSPDTGSGIILGMSLIIPLLIYVVSLVFLILGVVRYFENRKTQIR
jgi:hypothetical protein